MYSIKNAKCLPMRIGLIKSLKSEKTLEKFGIGGAGFVRNHTSSSGNSTTKWIAGSLICAITGVGGTLAYAKYDPKFLDMLEESIPYSKDVIRLILGKTETPLSANDSPTVPQLIRNDTISGKKIETDQESDDLKEKELTAADEIEKLKIFIPHKLKELEMVLKSAADAVSIHLKDAHELVSAFESDSTIDWEKLSLKAQKRTSEMAKITEIQNELGNAVKKAESLISQLKSEGSNVDSFTITYFDNLIHKVNLDLKKCDDELSKLDREVSTAIEFEKLVEDGWKKLKYELSILIPDVNMGDKISKLTEEDLNLLIAYYEKKIMNLVARSAHLQAIQNKKFLHELEQNRELFMKEADSDVKVKLKQQEDLLEIVHRKELCELREEYEFELRKQFRRQSAAHSDHLKEITQVLETELNKKYSDMLDEKLTQERLNYHDKLSRNIGQLKGLQGALKARADLEKASRQAQVLWLACQNLKTAIRLGNMDAKSWREKIQPLEAHVKAVRDLAGDNPFAINILEAIPEEAVTKGVFTEDALKERFLMVDKACRKVAMIDDNGGSLFKYLLSYLQSFIVIKTYESIPLKHLKDDAIDVTSLDTFEILNRTRFYLDRDDLQQALRYMNLLSGCPREVAKDWLKDARLNLEIRQAADALLTHASATNIEAYAT